MVLGDRKPHGTKGHNFEIPLYTPKIIMVCNFQKLERIRDFITEDTEKYKSFSDKNRRGHQRANGSSRP